MVCVDNGEKWTVLTVRYKLFWIIWNCQCVSVAGNMNREEAVKSEIVTFLNLVYSTIGVKLSIT